MKPTVNLFDTGIRPVVDAHLAKLAEEKRDYGDYWSASSAGYCMRKVIMERLNIPYVSEDARKQRIFSAGDVFHEWIQRITKGAGISLGQEIELIDDKLMIKGHADDLVLVGAEPVKLIADNKNITGLKDGGHLIVYDYKSAHSRSFHYAKTRPMSHYHKMQLGTYMYMLRNDVRLKSLTSLKLEEGRVLKISKDDLVMQEHQLLWSPELEKEVVGYWRTLNGYWKRLKLPKCTCDKHEGGFMAREGYNPYFYNGKPCSIEWYELKLNEAKEE